MGHRAGDAHAACLARKAPSATLADVGLAHKPCIRQVGPDKVEYLLIRTSKRSLTMRPTSHRASQGGFACRFVLARRRRRQRRQ